MIQKQGITNWGLYPVKEASLVHPGDLWELQEAVKAKNNMIARGNGRCYGDSSLGEHIISTLKMNRILEFDTDAGVIHCEAGLMLDDILKLIVPKGFFLPVSPGTKFITVGGALASDIHGKNHHVDGVFSDHVLSFSLINEKGEKAEITPENSLFHQTAGGMGLTGIIYAVRFRLKKIESSMMRIVKYRAANLKAIFDLFEQHSDPTYSVAWIDCLASGKKMGRSILIVGEHAKADEVQGNDLLKAHKPPGLNIPFYFPGWALNRWTVKAFNMLYYNNPLVKHGKPEVVHYDPYFYPLDAIHNWNRIYGKRGFTQYQFVLPKAVSYEGVSRILGIMQEQGEASFLAVLKLFGKSHEDRFLHFPQEGYTLAVDFQVNDKVMKMLDRFDEIVMELGGKIYLTKDARMKTETFDALYPNKPPLQPGFRSSQSERLGMH
jgi:decaprenylphospho-beta-D-ribofuranose 2-oxidase